MKQFVKHLVSTALRSSINANNTNAVKYLSTQSRSTPGLGLTVQASMRPSADPVEENLRLRRQLALSYRLLERLNLNEGACNHVSVVAPAKCGSGEVVMLLAPGEPT